jgi:hypothetical protein
MVKYILLPKKGVSVETLSIILIIISLSNSFSVYLVGTEKIKPKKSTEILYSIVAAIALFAYDLSVFQDNVLLQGVTIQYCNVNKWVLDILV